MSYKQCMLAAGCLLGMIPVCGAQTAAPAPDGFPVCYGHECSRQQLVQLDDRQWQIVRALFSPAATSAAERAMIRRAIAQLEDFAGVLAGTSGDRGGNVAGAGMPGQMDCIDESINTTTYLTLLQQDGLLRWHEVQERVRRSKWVLDVHWTAVMRETASGQRYAVDAWFLDNGEPPYIQRLEDWLDKEDFPEQEGRP
jgi:hypothetical protein